VATTTNYDATKISSRTRLDVRFTTRFRSPVEPVFEGKPEKMTIRQIMEEHRDLRRGGTYVGVEAHVDGQRVHWMDLEARAEEIEADRATT